MSVSVVDAQNLTSVPYEISPVRWQADYLAPKQSITFEVLATVVKCVDVSNYVFTGDRVNNIPTLYEIDSAHVEVVIVHPTVVLSSEVIYLSRLSTEAVNVTMTLTNLGLSPASGVNLV